MSSSSLLSKINLHDESIPYFIVIDNVVVVIIIGRDEVNDEINAKYQVLGLVCNDVS